MAAANNLLRGIVAPTAQQVLDELAGNIERNAIRGSPIAYLRGLGKRVHERTFTPECGLAVLKRRQAQCRARKAKALARERVLDYPGLAAWQLSLLAPRGLAVSPPIADRTAAGEMAATPTERTSRAGI